MKIQHVNIEYVHQVWSQVEPFLQKAIDKREGTGDYSMEQMKTMVVMGHWMLVVSTDEAGAITGAATVNYINRPNSRVAFVTCIGGAGIANQKAFEQLKVVLKSFGATAIEGAVNDAVARLWQRFGFSDKYRIVESKL
jgi:hypothetical protein